MITINDDSIKLSKKSIVPSSLIIKVNNKIIDHKNYEIDFSNSTLILNKNIVDSLNISKISVSFRVFPFNFMKPYSHKNDSIILKWKELEKITINKKSKKKIDILGNKNIKKSGNINRAMIMGNNQDLTVNSNLNLKLSGKINDKISIDAVLSDENIPIQEDGGTMQIKEFDKVYIKLRGTNFSLTAGDFVIKKPIGYFMNINMKSRGFDFEYLHKKENYSLKTKISTAIAKGKYKKIEIKAVEGNQGPYLLSLTDKQNYIIILSGSEKIYIDGKQINRGGENDYIINYNTGEITFTNKQIITSNNRIIAEFEYSERKYSKIKLHNSNVVETKNAKFWLNTIYEHDSKQNSYIEQSDSDKQLLSAIGDSLHLAFVNKADKVEYTNTKVLYNLNDTIVNSIIYDTVFIVATNNKNEVYELSFSYVGSNNGNYVLNNNNIYGRVYKWVAPQNGISQGDYEPIAKLYAPEKKQMFTIGTEFNLSDKTKGFFEFALSNYDINTYSTKNSSDNVAYSLKTNLIKIFSSDTNKLFIKSELDYTYISNNFSYFDEIKSVEFERDWNLQNLDIANDEHIIALNLYLKKKSNFYINFKNESLIIKSNYKAIKNSLTSNFNKSGFDIDFSGSILNTGSDKYKTRFIVYELEFSKIIKSYKLAVFKKSESNYWYLNQNDSIAVNSFRNYKWGAFVEKSKDSTMKFNLNYYHQLNYLPINNNLSLASKSDNINAEILLIKTNKSLNITFNYRKLDIVDTSSNQNLKNIDNLISGLSYSVNSKNKVFNLSGFYKISSGMEAKKDFTYIELEQGKGIYKWVDYNSNKIMEKEEFEIANFADEANYIKINIPTNDYIKVFSNNFSQSFYLNPKAKWRKKKGIKNFISKFTNRFLYHLNNKSFNKIFLQFDNNSSTILNSNITNILIYKISKKLKFNYIYKQNFNKNLLVNGTDIKKLEDNELKLGWQLLKDLQLNYTYNIAGLFYESEYFALRNYNINSISNKLSIIYKNDFYLKTEVFFKYKEKQNTQGSEFLQSYEANTNLEYNIVNKIAFIFNISYTKIKYNETQNTPVSYAMLKGLIAGDNYIWSLNINKKINKYMNLIFYYSGRYANDKKTIHIGNFQLNIMF